MGKLELSSTKLLKISSGMFIKNSKITLKSLSARTLFTNNWKLKIIFDAEEIKGKLTVKTGNKTLFDQSSEQGRNQR